jgi:hypothetical protein
MVILDGPNQTSLSHLQENLEPAVILTNGHLEKDKTAVLLYVVKLIRLLFIFSQ